MNNFHSSHNIPLEIKLFENIRIYSIVFDVFGYAQLVIFVPVCNFCTTL